MNNQNKNQNQNRNEQNQNRNQNHNHKKIHKPSGPGLFFCFLFFVFSSLKG